MTHPRLARLATDALADAAVDSTPPPPSPEEEARAIQLIAEAIRERASARRRRRTLLAAGGFAVAAGVVLAIGWRSHGRGAPVTQSAVLPAASATEVTAVAHALTDGVVVLRAGAQLGLEAGGSIVRDDRVVTTNGGRASVVLSTGTHLVIEEGTDFSVVEQGSMQAFALRAGSVRADVAKLRQGQRFSIRTNDAEVEVRGTSFRVQVLPESAPCSAGIMTRVTVNEGVVAVRTSQGEVLVHKDETWPRPCSASPAAEPVPLPTVQPVGGSAASRIVPPASAAPSTVPPAVASDPPSVRRQSSSSGDSAAAASELAQQNALFSEATAARRRGDVATAVALYERLAARHPSSPLAESALVERMRVLATSDRRKGADAARAYLQRYPSGFARSEATELAARSP